MTQSVTKIKRRFSAGLKIDDSTEKVCSPGESPVCPSAVELTTGPLSRLGYRNDETIRAIRKHPSVDKMHFTAEVLSLR